MLYICILYIFKVVAIYIIYLYVLRNRYRVYSLIIKIPTDKNPSNHEQKYNKGIKPVITVTRPVIHKYEKSIICAMGYLIPKGQSRHENVKDIGIQKWKGCEKKKDLRKKNSTKTEYLSL